MLSPEYKTLPRLYVTESAFADGKNIELSDNQAHYLRNVMRKASGDRLRAFNGTDGEWVATIKELNKKNVIIQISNILIKQKSSPNIWVLAPSIKKDAFEFMIEKASELGVSRFMPVICDHSTIHRMNEERAQSIAVESAEQCERLDILKVEPLKNLRDVLTSWDPTRKLIFCQERGEAEPVMAALQKLTPRQPFALLVGPEGGFSDKEIAEIRNLPYAVPVSLGPRILRTETAFCAALSCLQAACGDWTER